ncbi:hypothetical protein K491DRAFT_722164 [Lophiostoma macrostomum CBS 122681]|uniref:Uncharacterized protein n=1 Tax=Lophiostoma macrostomum CBS 122681 TaxID=1314788 RepID=A0A6A6SMR0_9PLEO|nr:hypothetical protein K491DRAFT_722164 [Lophiostoma macrostomum CBS 122681]
MSPHAPLPSPLLLLPRELRDAIYSSSFLEGCYVFKQATLTVEVCLGDSIALGWNIDHYRRLPIWLVACKQSSSEGLSQFYHEAICSGFRGMRCAKAMDAASSNQYLSLHRIERFDFASYWHEPEFTVITKSKMLEDKKGTLVSLWCAPVLSRPTYLDRLLSYLCENGSAARELKIRFSRPFGLARLDPEELEHVEFDFGVLESFNAKNSRLNRVTFVIDQPVIYDYEVKAGYVLQSECIHLTMQRGLEMIGKQLVCQNPIENDTEWSVKDWWGPQQCDYFRIQHSWHLEVCRTKSGPVGQIKHRGMSSWRDRYGYTMVLPVIYRHRTQSEDGIIEWYSSDGKTGRIQLPQALR